MMLAQTMAQSPICPACGCSLVRLGIERSEAPACEHDGRQLLFCCEGCVDLFQEHPERFLEEISDWIVGPTCLDEKPKALTVSITHGGREILFCRCPHCIDKFRRRPDELFARFVA